MGSFGFAPFETSSWETFECPLVMAASSALRPSFCNHFSFYWDAFKVGGFVGGEKKKQIVSYARIKKLDITWVWELIVAPASRSKDTTVS